MLCRARFAIAVLLLSVSALLGALPASAAPRKAKVIRVPKDVKDLQTAIRSVKHGEIIELAKGTYAAPVNGLSITNLGKSFTIRAAQGAVVILDGQGKAPILRFKNGDRSRGKLVTFERITFQNGFSKNTGDGGAVTLTAAEARFVDCRFLASTATATGGGAVRVLTGSEATFVRTEWRGNSSAVRGGALEILSAVVTIEGGSFVENRTNLPGHKTTSSGGAIYVLDSTLRVSDVRFERNQAGWVGGAIYAFGKWTEPLEVPKADLTVVRSTFLENVAANDLCCVPPGPTQGGAIHVEDHTTLRVQHSHLQANRAKLGGGINSYRAIVEVTGSLFQWNQALEGTAFGAGGAIFASSNETGASGPFNRRPILLTIADSLLQGGTGQPAAHTGGCVAAGGDASRAYGENGAIQMGTLEENRARIEVRRSVLADCDVQRDPTGGGFGGALKVDVANLLVEDSLVMESDARGDGAGGGGVAVQNESVATFLRTTFARNSAERWGGALFAGGSHIQVSQCRFFGNDVRPGFAEQVAESRGAALFTIPLLSELRPRNVSGVVADSIFSENIGLPVWDVDPQSGPINDVRYDNNQFYETAFFDKVYVNTLVSPNGAGASTLSRTVVDRPGRASTDKSLVSNVRLFSPPVAGTLLAAPSVVGTGAPPLPGTLLGYAWSGRTASLDGQGLTARSGVLLAGAGAHTLLVDGTQVAAVVPGTATCANGAVCLAGGRFEVRVPGARLLAREADMAFFSLPGGAVLAVQLLDRRDTNGHFWLVRSVSNLSGVSALSGHTLEISDTSTGDLRTWGLVPVGSDTGVDRRAFPDK
jgi:hypothetical protein